MKYLATMVVHVMSLQAQNCRWTPKSDTWGVLVAYANFGFEMFM